MKKNKEQKEIKQKKERRLPRFHVLDVVIILLVVAILAGVYFRYNVFDTLGNLQNQSEANVTFSVENIQDSTRYYIDIGEELYFKADGKTFGTIMESAENSDRALVDEPASEMLLVTYPDGTQKFEPVYYPSGTRIDVTGKIRCVGKFADDGSFLLGGSTYICPGQTIEVCTERVTLLITVTAIENSNS